MSDSPPRFTPMSSTRLYFSARTGRNPSGANYEFDTLRRLFLISFRNLEAAAYFQEAFGFNCVDEGWLDGTAGPNLDAFFFQRAGKNELWPFDPNEKHTSPWGGVQSEDDLFDVIEVLFDIVSQPVEGWDHPYNSCGWHGETFDRKSGQSTFRSEMNRLLARYGPGWELSIGGEIMLRGEPGLRDLLSTPLPASADPQNVKMRVQHAVRQFRLRGSSLNDRRQAVRELADVLEFLRPRLKQILTRKDEGDLFNIANNFGIRHHNDQQQTGYEQAIWLSWMFHYYLATIHMATRRLELEK